MDLDLFEVDLLSNALIAWEENKKEIDLGKLSHEFQESMRQPYDALLKQIQRSHAAGDTLPPDKIILDTAIWLCRDPRDLFAGGKLQPIGEMETEEAPL